MVYPVKPSTFQLGLSGMRTTPLLPSNERALPYFPAVVQLTPPRSVPVLLLPDASAVVVPEPSLKPRAMTGVVVPPPVPVVKRKSPETARLPAASFDLTR